MERGVDLARGSRDEIDEPFEGEVDVHLHGTVGRRGTRKSTRPSAIQSAMFRPVVAFDFGVGRTLAPRTTGLPRSAAALSTIRRASAMNSVTRRALSELRLARTDRTEDEINLHAVKVVVCHGLFKEGESLGAHVRVGPVERVSWCGL